MSYSLEILPSLLHGAVTTLEVFALVLIFSIPLGILIAFAMQLKWKPLNWFIHIYIIVTLVAKRIEKKFSYYK